MGTYRERASTVGGAVVWHRSAEGAETADTRVLPDGCMDLIWMHGALVVAGPDTVAHVARAPGAFTGIRFPPGLGPAVLGLPAVELRDRRVPLADVWDAREVRVWTGRVAEAEAPGRVLEHIAALRLRETAPDPVARAVAAGLARGERVAGLADRVGLSGRQLHRRSVAAFGYGPKTLGRVLRLGRALELARGGEPFADVAVRAGYADQAHLAREVRSLAGVPLTALVRG
ncbi:helix-turn-helix transcriptional regulator [Yinghuangia sp. ASG 101]|uniref:helix-turn-helix transcriptional regulator n=1 Tax=Yinghuangia sp. ASG 101 TaxID=2896848 RepID=UPI001E5BEBDB|nr:helix-turn-helix transcriptional regulator [Yinghuangia sp. ASG 101]UGQ13927.1 helix-turn-helix transcriptional regulator [Yinghuangia sp. ASG 101]